MIQKYIDEAKEVIGNVKATEENYTFEESREEDINFYSESFWLLVVLMEQATGMVLVEDDNFPSPMDDFMERLHEKNR